MTTIAPTRYPRRQRSLKIVSVATGCAIGLLCGEIGARTFAWLREASKRSDFERMRTGPSALRLDREAKLGEIVCPSAFDDVIYELIPSCSALFQGVPCSFNADGYRGPPLPARKREPGSLRIVGLGDSVMFGWGIDEPDCFLRRIERTLRARMPERLVEVVNTGVPGYNTAMEVAAFEHKTLSLRPDVILIDWVGNDADLPNLVATDSSPFDLSRSFHGRTLRTRPRTRADRLPGNGRRGGRRARPPAAGGTRRTTWLPRRRHQSLRRSRVRPPVLPEASVAGTRQCRPSPRRTA